MKSDRRKQVKQLYKAVVIKDLTAITAKFDATVREQIIDVVTSHASRTKINQALVELRKEAQGTQAQVQKWLDKSIPEAYATGMRQTDSVLKSAGINTGNQKITGKLIMAGASDMRPHYQAVTAMLQDAYLDFGQGMTSIISKAQTTMTEALREQIRDRVVEGRVTGESVETIAKGIMAQAKERGYSALVDRGGRNWSLERYSDMLSRTHIMRANNEGTLMRAVDWDIDIVEISDHATESKICIPYEGNIYSISGNSKNYEKLPATPPFHPNCQHVMLLRPDLE